MKRIAVLGVSLYLMIGCTVNRANIDWRSLERQKVISALDRHNIPVNSVMVDPDGLISVFLGECQNLDSRIIGQLGSCRQVSCYCARFDLGDLAGSPELFHLDIRCGILLHPERILEFKELTSLSCCILRPFEGEELINRMKRLGGDISVLATRESILALQKCPNAHRYSLLMTRRFFESLSEEERLLISRIPVTSINASRSDVFWKEPCFFPESMYSFYRIPELEMEIR